MYHVILNIVENIKPYFKTYFCGALSLLGYHVPNLTKLNISKDNIEQNNTLPPLRIFDSIQNDRVEDFCARLCILVETLCVNKSTDHGKKTK